MLQPIDRIQRFNRVLRGSIIVFSIAMLVSCSSGEKKVDSVVLFDPNEPEPAQSQNASVDVTPIENPSPQSQELITPVDIPDPKPLQPEGLENEAGWILTSRSQETVSAILRKADSLGVTHVQFGGDVLVSVDDLILDDEVRQFVEQAVKPLDAQGIDTLVWSRELNLEGETFRFKISAPLVAARQAAYRTALRNIPQLDGVVLVFSGARLEAWNAAIPANSPSLTVPDRLRFIIDIVRSVVVEELGKQLLIRADAKTPEQLEWIVRALESYGKEVDVSIPITLSGGALVGPLNPILGRLSKHRLLVEYDLAGTAFGGPVLLVLCGDELARRRMAIQSHRILGGAAAVQSGDRMIFDTPNELNFSVLSKIGAGHILDMEPLWIEWIERRYGLLPTSREGQTLLRIARSSFDCARRMTFAKNLIPVMPQGTLLAMDEWPPEERFMSLKNGYEYIANELAVPGKQTLLDLAQESFEALNLLDNALENLPLLRNRIEPVKYEDLERRLTFQRQMAEILFYTKQAYWGFRFWKRTGDEDEALCLESHLQRLEGFADTVEQTYGANATPGNPARIRAFAASIRSQFPRVILGAKDRTWNRLRTIAYHQTGPSSLELRWTSERPAFSRIFLSTRLPVFERMLTASHAPETDHYAIINGLEPGTTYFIKIQCTAGSGEVTNSGEFLFRLETPSLM